ncbi:MAG: hypothetical protein ACYS99_02135 [Planctomycetota bacterium]|jgi:hypothetical protein
MMWKRSLSVVLLGVLLVAGVALAPGLRAGDDVPLKGSATATFQSHDWTTRTSHFTLEGTSSHLGLISGDAYVLFEYEPVPHPVSAEVIMVAANGDELTLATSQAGQSYTITGGTGRFAGATGSGTFIATGAGEVSLSWDGTIDYKKN